jgi:hypothetical protein
VLLAVSEPDLVVVQASEDLAGLTGIVWSDALGRPLADVLGVAATDAVVRSASAFGDLRERNPVEVPFDVDGDPVPVDAILHRTVLEGARDDTGQPAEGFDDGLDRLGAALTDLRARPVEEVCDEVLARLVPEGAEDDVALLAVRLSG